MVETAQERQTIGNEIRTAIRQMAVYGLGGLLIKAVGFVMLPFYTHYLTPADYGILEILDLSMSLFGLLLNMGLTPAFLRCYAAVKTEEERRRVVSTGTLFAIVTGACTFLVGLALIRPASLLLFGPQFPPYYLLLSFSSLVLSYIANLPRTYLRAMEASGTYTAVDTVYTMMLLGLNILFIAGLKTGLVGVLWSSVMAGSLQCVLMCGWAIRKCGLGLHRHHLARMLAFGGPLIISNVGLFVLNFSDRFFLQHLRSLDVVGIYAVGYKFGYMLNFLAVQPFFVMWQSRMYAIHAQPEHPKIFQQFFSLYSLGLIYVGLAMSLFSSEAVAMMVAPKFAASRDVIPVVVLAYICYGASYYAQSGLFLTDNTRTIAILGAATAVLDLALNYVLISAYGMMGAAWATVLSFAFLAALSYVYSERVLRLRLGMLRGAGGLVLAAALFVACRTWCPEPGVRSVAVKLLALAVFPAVAWQCGLLSQSAAGVIRDAGQGLLGATGRRRAAIARGTAAK